MLEIKHQDFSGSKVIWQSLIKLKEHKIDTHVTFLQRLQEVADQALHLSHMGLFRVNDVFEDHIAEFLDL